MTSLWSVTQGPNETLESYTKMFTTTYSCVTNPNEELAIQAYVSGVANENVQLSDGIRRFQVNSDDDRDPKTFVPPIPRCDLTANITRSG